MSAHDRLVTLIQAMLDTPMSSSAHQRHAAEANPQVKTVLQRQIEATDWPIDQLTY